jgi:hypothetical protein
MSQDGRALAPVQFPELKSWTEHSNPDIKYFSGVATYSQTLQVPQQLLGSGRRLYLDLGEVRVIARVRVNGVDAGVCWTRPFQVEITGQAKAGANQVEIEVANTWANRITGDAISKLPKRTNARWSPDAPLLPSGLLGPVRLVSAGERGLALRTGSDLA